MKKQLKKLSLIKKVISNFESISGGIPPKSWARTCDERCQVGEPAPDPSADFYCPGG